MTTPPADPRQEAERLDLSLDDYKALLSAFNAQAEEIATLQAERDKWLDAFNRSEQFQNGPTKRAEVAEARIWDAVISVDAIEHRYSIENSGDLHERIDRIGKRIEDMDREHAGELTELVREVQQNRERAEAAEAARREARAQALEDAAEEALTRFQPGAAKWLRARAAAERTEEK